MKPVSAFGHFLEGNREYASTQKTIPTSGFRTGFLGILECVLDASQFPLNYRLGICIVRWPSQTECITQSEPVSNHGLASHLKDAQLCYWLQRSFLVSAGLRNSVALCFYTHRKTVCPSPTSYAQLLPRLEW